MARARLQARAMVMPSGFDLELRLRAVLGVENRGHALGEFLGIAELDELQVQFQVCLTVFVHDDLLQVKDEYRLALCGIAFGRSQDIPGYRPGRRLGRGPRKRSVAG